MSAPNPGPAGDTSDREIRISRVFDAPRDLVWRAMTDPQHVTHWWGPRGFSTTIEKMDFKVGGVWKHTMHGPDGVNYPNKSIFKEIVTHERIVYSHGGGRENGGPGATFVATWTFDALEAGKTKLTLHMVFPSADDRDLVVREFGAIEGGQQTLERLSEYLPKMPPATKDFILTRTFDAPRALLWDVWTDPAHLKQWLGPKGFTMPTCAMELRPGGVFHYCLKSADGHAMWGKWTFLEIVKPEKLVVLVSFSDAKRGVTRHPMSPTWPLETLSTTTFTEQNGKTTLTLRCSAYNASEAERRIFDSSHDDMKQGWGGTMEQLEGYLAKLKAR